jgi:hypothetical protein
MPVSTVWFGRPAVSSQVHGYDKVPLREIVGDAVPDVMRLGKSMQEKHRRARAAVDAVDGDVRLDGDVEGGEIVEHD